MKVKNDNNHWKVCLNFIGYTSIVIGFATIFITILDKDKFSYGLYFIISLVLIYLIALAIYNKTNILLYINSDSRGKRTTQDIILSKETRNMAIVHAITGLFDSTYNNWLNNSKQDKKTTLFESIVQTTGDNRNKLIGLVVMEFLFFLYSQTIIIFKDTSPTVEDFSKTKKIFNDLFLDTFLAIFIRQKKKDILPYLDNRLDYYSKLDQNFCNEHPRNDRIIHQFFYILKQNLDTNIEFKNRPILEKKISDLIFEFHKNCRLTISALDQYLNDNSRSKFIVPYRGGKPMSEGDLKKPTEVFPEYERKKEEGGYIPQDQILDICKKRKNINIKLPEITSGTIKRNYDNLMESTIPKESWYRFSAGQSLAIMHSFGLYHGDLHKSHMRFNPDTGSTIFLDFDSCSYMNLTPDYAYIDIIPAYLSLNEDDFHSFVSGYINISSTYIDTKYINFTNELLEISGIKVASRLLFLVNDVRVKEIVKVFGFMVNFKNNKFVLDQLETYPTFISNMIEDPDEIMRVLCGLIFAGVDCSPIYNKLKLGNSHLLRKENYFKILEILYDYENNIPKTNFNDSFESELFRFFIKIRETLDKKIFILSEKNKVTLELIIVQMLYKEQQSFMSKSGHLFLEKIVDVFDYLNDMCLSTPLLGDKTFISMNLTQTSAIILSLIAHSNEKELRINTMLRRTYTLPWMTQFLAPHNDDSMIMQEIAYSNSRACTFTNAFEASLSNSEFQNPCFSMIWRSIILSQQMVLATRRLLTQSHNSYTDDEITYTTRCSINRFIQTMYAYSNAMISTKQINIINNFWSSSSGHMSRQLNSAVSLMGLLNNVKAASPMVIEGLNRLIEIMEEDRVYSPTNMLLR